MWCGNVGLTHHLNKTCTKAVHEIYLSARRLWRTLTPSLYSLHHLKNIHNSRYKIVFIVELISNILHQISLNLLISIFYNIYTTAGLYDRNNQVFLSLHSDLNLSENQILIFSFRKLLTIPLKFSNCQVIYYIFKKINVYFLLKHCSLKNARKFPQLLHETWIFSQASDSYI